MQEIVSMNVVEDIQLRFHGEDDIFGHEHVQTRYIEDHSSEDCIVQLAEAIAEDKDAFERLKPGLAMEPFAFATRSPASFLPGLEHLTNLEVRMASASQGNDPERVPADSNVVDQTGGTAVADQGMQPASLEQQPPHVPRGSVSASNQDSSNPPPPPYSTPPNGNLHSPAHEQTLSSNQDTRVEVGLAQFIAHYRGQLQQGRAAPGWH